MTVWQLERLLCLPQVVEAEIQYRQCVSDAKIHQDELVKVKERIISHIRKLICQGDTVLKEVRMKSNDPNIYLPIVLVGNPSVISNNKRE